VARVTINEARPKTDRGCPPAEVVADVRVAAGVDCPAGVVRSRGVVVADYCRSFAAASSRAGRSNTRCVIHSFTSTDLPKNVPWRCLCLSRRSSFTKRQKYQTLNCVRRAVFMLLLPSRLIHCRLYAGEILDQELPVHDAAADGAATHC